MGGRETERQEVWEPRKEGGGREEGVGNAAMVPDVFIATCASMSREAAVSAAMPLPAPITHPNCHDNPGRLTQKRF